MAGYQVEQALRKAAEKLVGRPITDQELRRIVEGYEKAAGTPFDRAVRGLSEGTNQTEPQIRTKSAASDDTKRVMQDLRDILNKSK